MTLSQEIYEISTIFENAEVSIIQTKYHQSSKQIWLRETKTMFLGFRFAFLAAHW